MKIIPRRLVTTFIAGALAGLGPGHYPAYAEVQLRTEDELLQRRLYQPPPESKSYSQQLSDAQPIKTMRGVWHLQEYNLEGKLVSDGTLTFRGSDSEPERGQVTYEGNAGAGRGPWILKADGFGRSQTGVGGIIEKKALWKLRRGTEGTFTYAGRINVPSFTGTRPDATIEGPVVQLINGGKPKGGSEKKVGRFEANLERFLVAAEEDAAVDSAAAGGAPERLEIIEAPLNLQYQLFLYPPHRGL